MRFTVEEEKHVLARSGLLVPGDQSSYTPMVTQDMLDELRRRYSEPRRHYHVWDHALQVLSWVNYICEQELVPATAATDLRLAALFHDAVYDASKGAPHNEAASVEVLRSMGFRRGLTEEIIMATAQHGKTAHGDLPELIALFLDCDIAHFGERRWEIVRWNDDNVSREYEYVYTPEQVAKGRKAFLEGMVSAGRRIYMSSHFYDLFERQAHHNLQRLIDEAP